MFKLIQLLLSKIKFNTRVVEGFLIQAINKKYEIKNLIIKKVTRKSILGI